MRLAVLERRSHLRDVPFTIVSWDASSFARYLSVLIELSKKKAAGRSHTSAYWNERRGVFVTEAYFDLQIRRGQRPFFLFSLLADARGKMPLPFTRQDELRHEMADACCFSIWERTHAIRLINLPHACMCPAVVY
jgi:hypothetical protein